MLELFSANEKGKTLICNITFHLEREMLKGKRVLVYFRCPYIVQLALNRLVE
jgi:hypothetical protein